MLAGFVGKQSVDAKKRKKKCAKKCTDGCCTSKHGKCIPRVQQSSTQCGTNGEICRTNCEGQLPPDTDTCGPENCQSGCCAGTTCEFSIHAHCGIGGASCVACAANEECFVGKCCGLQGHTCAGNGECCLNRLCENGKCCSGYGVACSRDSDCCDPDVLVCSNGECLIKNGQPCELLQRCELNVSCPASGRCCAANGRRCEATVDCCDPDEDICDGGFCKRKRNESCDNSIVCQDAYPNCVDGACRKCPVGQQDFGTSEICCTLPPNDFGGCAAANGGVGACCEFEDCCKVNAGGGGVCLETEYGTPSC